MVTDEQHHFIRDLTIGGMMAEDLAIVTKLPVFWGQLSNFTADRCALSACGRSEAIARSWIRSAMNRATDATRGAFLTKVERAMGRLA
jgi:hypothetical protein